MVGSNDSLREYLFPVFYTQGGGLVKEAGRNPYRYEFVEAPEQCLNLGVGDPMPEEWSIVPANRLARELLDDEQFGSPEDHRKEIAEILARYSKKTVPPPFEDHDHAGE